MENNKDYVDWRKFGQTLSIEQVVVALNRWSSECKEGKVCGMFGCLNQPLEKCSHCPSSYCKTHLKYHKILCEIG